MEVDGQAAEILLTGDAMVGVMLTEGDHEVRFVYENKAFSIGWKVSLVCALVLVILAYVSDLKNSPKGKYEKKKEKH